MIDKLAKIYIHSMYLAKSIFYRLDSTDGRRSGIERKAGGCNEIGNVSNRIIRFYGKKGVLSVPGWKDIVITSIVCSRSGYSGNSCSIIEFKNNRILINYRSG